MLTVVIPSEEAFDETTSEFISEVEVVVKLEHSLVSLSKWESFFEKPFLASVEKTNEEILWYVRAMITSPDISEEVFRRLTVNEKCMSEINDYINAKMTATWFLEDKKPGSSRGETITAEIVYYWMIAMNIPFECQHWHLNRLLTLVRVCNQKNAPQKKLTPAQAAKKQRELNEQRKAQLKTSG